MTQSRSRLIFITVGGLLMMTTPLLPASAATSGAAAASAPRSSSTQYTFSSKSVSAGGYAWSFSGVKNGSGTTIDINATRRAATGNLPTQSYQWSFFSLPGNAFSTDSTDLVPSTIATSTGMGPFGHVSMKLTNPKALSTSTKKCKANGNVLQKIARRSGTWSGHFDFLPGESGLPTEIKTTTLAGTVVKTTFTGKSCPIPTTCFVGRGFGANHNPVDPASPAWFVSASSSKAGTRIQLQTSTYDTTNNVLAFQRMAASVPSSAVSITASAITVDGTALDPFASGSLQFAAGSPVVNTVGNCQTTSYTDTWSSGTIQAIFDTGTMPITQPVDSASSQILVKV
jgi:hypothetical protein